MKDRKVALALQAGLAVLAFAIARSAFEVGEAQADDTGLLNPSAQAADTGGDGDGFELNPTDAFADDAAFATNDNGGGDRHRFYDYSISVPGGATINGIEVRLDWWLDRTNGTNSMSVELSWDVGSTWTVAKTDTTESETEHTTVLGGSAESWGRTWAPSELNDDNFRVRVTSNASGGGSQNRDFFLDWVAVKVYFTPSGGTLTISTSPITFPGVTLNGTDQTVTGSTSAWQADASGQGGGWNVDVSSTDFGIDEVQQVYNSATAGTFTLTFSGQTTAAIAYNASVATMESSLEALSNITDVNVTGSGTSGDPWVVTFVDPGKQNVAEMTADDTNLTGGTSTISTATEGRTIAVANFEIRLLDGNIVVVSGDINKPVSTQTTFVSLSGTALKIASAALGEGDGIYDLTPGFQLTVPGGTFTGSYTAAVTVTISDGP